MIELGVTGEVGGGGLTKVKIPCYDTYHSQWNEEKEVDNGSLNLTRQFVSCCWGLDNGFFLR